MLGWARRTVRERPWLVTVLALAVAIRVAAQITYSPALLFSGDSYGYLSDAQHLHPGTWHPLGYPIFLRVLSVTHQLAMVPLVQHAMGITVGLLIYRMLAGAGVRDFGCALGAAPILLDAWQIDLEQYVMSESLFELLLFLGVYLLLRGRRRRGLLIAGAALIACATLTRTAAAPIGLLLIAYAAMRRAGWRNVGLAAAAFCLPLLGYAAAFDSAHGTFAITGFSGRQVYGEAATIARCDKLPRNTLDRVLCPRTPLGERAGNNQYTWDGASPLSRLPVRSRNLEPALEVSRLGGKFARTVITRQPLGFLRLVTTDTARYFGWGRTARPQDYQQMPWQFLGIREPPATWSTAVAAPGFQHPTPGAESGLGPLARPLRAYQRVGYTPGLLLGLCVLLAALALLRRPRGVIALEASVLGIAGLVELVLPSLGAGFDYRYVLPALLFLPAAGVLAAKSLGLARRVPRGRTGGLVAAAVAVLFGALNVWHSGVLPVSKERPNALHPIGTTVALGDGLSVTASPPGHFGAVCRPMPTGPARWVWFGRTAVSVRTSGRPSLVQTINFSTHADGRYFLARRVRHNEPLLPLVLLSRRYPVVTGSVVVTVAAPHETLLYVDPYGAGVAAWDVNVDDPALPPPGQPCSPSSG